MRGIIVYMFVFVEIVHFIQGKYQYMLMGIRYSIKVEPTQCQNDEVSMFKRRFKVPV